MTSTPAGRRVTQRVPLAEVEDLLSRPARAAIAYVGPDGPECVPVVVQPRHRAARHRPARRGGGGPVGARPAGARDREVNPGMPPFAVLARYAAKCYLTRDGLRCELAHARRWGPRRRYHAQSEPVWLVVEPTAAELVAVPGPDAARTAG